MIGSQLFFSDANIRAKILGPTEYLIGAIRSLEFCEVPPSTMILAQWVARMGQDLFYPPNVGGWSEGRSWLSSRNIVARAKNFAKALIGGEIWHPSKPPDLNRLAAQHGAAADLKSRINWLVELLWGEVPHELVDEIFAAVESKKSAHPLSTAVALLLAKAEYHLA